MRRRWARPDAAALGRILAPPLVRPEASRPSRAGSGLTPPERRRSVRSQAGEARRWPFGKCPWGVICERLGLTFDKSPRVLARPTRLSASAGAAVSSGRHGARRYQVPGATSRPAAAGRAPIARDRRAGRGARGIVPPVLVRQVRNGIVESEHRGSIVEADVDGRLLHLLGDPDRLVTLRSCVKPFSAVAFVEAGGIEAFEVEPAELAIMASSHSGEDLHVRTIQALYRRAHVPQSALACGTEGMPLDELTAARLARDGERPSAIRHMCSGQHSVFLLLSKMNGWPLEGYWRDDHPAQVAYRQAVATAFRTEPDRLISAIDGCGIATFAFPLREVARAYAFLADPTAVAPTDPRARIAASLLRVRDAMVAHPEMVAGTHGRLDTSLMKAAPGALVSKGGMEALRGVAILPGARSGGRSGGGRGAAARASGLALKVEDGDGYKRATWAATIEAAAQVGVIGGTALRGLGRYHRPPSMDPHGRLAGEAVPEFALAPVGELLG